MAKTAVCRLNLGLVNAFLLESGGNAVLVDSGYPGSGIASRLGALGLENGQPRLALLTHAHSDHFGGLAGLLDLMPDLKVAVGEADAEGLAQGVDVDLEPLGRKGRLFARLSGAGRHRDGGQARAAGRGIKADLLFQGGESLALYGLDARILATPGHTRGSLSVFLEDAEDGEGRPLGPVAVVGDLVMGGFVLKKRPSPPFFASGMDELRSSLAILRGLGVKTLFTGHGGPLEAERVFTKFGLR